MVEKPDPCKGKAHYVPQIGEAKTRGRGEKIYILQGPAFGTFIPFLTGDRSRPTPVRVAIKSDHDILP